MNVLGIETSCDETSAAVVGGGCRVLSSVVYSQIDHHRAYGGVVPEIAARRHVAAIRGTILEALTGSGLEWNQIDAVAVTRGPGLASSLIVGVTAARALSWRLGKPLLGLNHLEAHLYSVFLNRDRKEMGANLPMMVLTVSGGHTCLAMMHGLHDYEVLGVSLDDAAGEALDKGAKLLGLGYPGGPFIERCAYGGDPAFVSFPRGQARSVNAVRYGNYEPRFCFSFSGLKTALRYYLLKHPEVMEDARLLKNVACSYQEAVVDVLVDRTADALEHSGARTLACVGGVASNSRLRDCLQQMANRYGVQLLLIAPEYCTDNAAMVAGLGGALIVEGIDSGSETDIAPALRL